MAPIKLLIVDDHKVFAQGLEAIFSAQPDFAPLPAVTDPDRVLGAVASCQPDVVIMDVLLGDVSGIDLTAQLTVMPAPPAVVVLTAYADAVTAADNYFCCPVAASAASRRSRLIMCTVCGRPSNSTRPA